MDANVADPCSKRAEVFAASARETRRLLTEAEGVCRALAAHQRADAVARVERALTRLEARRACAQSRLLSTLIWREGDDLEPGRDWTR